MRKLTMGKSSTVKTIVCGQRREPASTAGVLNLIFAFALALLFATALTLTSGLPANAADDANAAKSTNPSSATKAGQLVAIGSGSVGGVYYPAAGALCRLLNNGISRHGVRCLVDRSGGSVQNVTDILQNRIDFGIVQTDVQADRYRGVGRFAQSGGAPNLRALFTVHPEPFTVIARLDSGIASFADLRGKRVNLGKPNSGTRATMELVMQAYGIEMGELAVVGDLSAAEAADGLCENKFDAFVYVVGHPNRVMRTVSESCAVRLVEVVGSPRDKLLAEHEYYAGTTIPGGLYVGNEQPVATFGVRASVVGLDSVPESIAYELTRAVFTRLQDLRGLHPAFQALSEKEMLQGNTAPFHQGALRYFKEAGISVD